MRHFEDFTPGLTGRHGPVHVTADDIIAFAAEFDPQPMHLDAEAAKDSLLGGLAASGWHTCSLMMRLIYDGLLVGSSGMGSPGVDELKWLRPVRPGDDLTLEWQVVETRASRSRPDMGLIKFAFTMSNQSGETVLTMSNIVMFGVRGTAAAGA